MRLTSPLCWTPLAVYMIFLTACQEVVVDDLPSFGNHPRIRVIELLQDTLLHQKDSLEIALYISDEDGDVGSDDESINSLFVLDSRLESYQGYHLPVLSGQISKNIDTVLNIRLNPSFVISNQASEEKTVFTLFVTDRAGNQSNMATLDTITIIR